MKRLPTLDIDLLRTFAAVADSASFTAAGDLMGATQSAMSVRIRKLEDRLGKRLLERSPRAVALTMFGETFLDSARRILRAHDEAALVAVDRDSRRTVAIAVSDHAAGAGLPTVLADLHRRRPDIQFTVTIGSSVDLLRGFEAGENDAVVVRREVSKGAGLPLYPDQLVWTAVEGFGWRPGTTVPLVSLVTPCGIRAIAIAALGATGIGWREVFTGTGVAAVQAAVAAGLGIACLGARNVPSGCVRFAPDAGLPPLPALAFVLHHRLAEPGDETIATAIADAFQAGAARQPC